MEVIVVLVVALTRMEGRQPQQRQAADEVKNEMTKVFVESLENMGLSAARVGVAAGEDPEAASTVIPTFSTKSDFVACIALLILCLRACSCNA